MKNKLTVKQIAAWIGIIVLVAMYVVLLIEAILGKPGTQNVFFACVAATIAVPIVLWIFLWAYSAITGRHNIASLDAMESDKAHDKNGNIIPDGQIKTVIFDIGNVLVNFDWKAFIKTHGGYDDEMSARIGRASCENHAAWDEFDIGNKSLTEIVDGFVAADPEIETEIRHVFTDLSGLITKKENAIPWIEAVKAAGYKTLVLSNFSSFAIEPNQDAMAFLEHVDGGILSYKDHVIKPDPAIYKLLMSRYDLKPEECVFIDDTEKNIIAARELGMHGIVYKSYEQVVADLHKLGVNY